MKKIIFIRLVTAILIAIVLSSCSDGSRIEKGKRMIADSNDGYYTKMHADWPYYKTEQDLIDASDAVFVGTVKQISFMVTDWETGSKELKEDSEPMLQTIYTIETAQKYKGSAFGTVQIMIVGGIPDFRENEQRQLWSAVKQSERFPVLAEVEHLVEGESYLFFLSKIGNNDHYSIVNAEEFAMDPNCSFARNAVKKLNATNADAAEHGEIPDNIE